MAPEQVVGQKYRLIRPIGEGGMGSVWAAVHMQTERQVAVKLIHREAAMDTAVRERMLREARACGRVTHRHVIEILDAGLTEEGDPFLVMPLLRGETLSERLMRDRCLPWPVAARFGADIAKGLAAAHAAGIVHRDLKPGNIFLSYEADVDEPIIKLLDFGVSKMVESFESCQVTKTGSVLGSPAYMSPEQVRGDRTVDYRADIWSLGVVLFEMLTGTFPFRGENAYAVVAEILHGAIPSVSDHAPDVDPRLSALVSKCLEREVHLRVGSACEMADALKQLLAGAPPSPPSVHRSIDGGAETMPFAARTSVSAPSRASTPHGPSTLISAQSLTPVRTVPGSRKGVYAVLGVVGALVAAGSVGLVASVRARTGETRTTLSTPAPAGQAASSRPKAEEQGALVNAGGSAAGVASSVAEPAVTAPSVASAALSGASGASGASVASGAARRPRPSAPSPSASASSSSKPAPPSAKLPANPG